MQAHNQDHAYGPAVAAIILLVSAAFAAFLFMLFVYPFVCALNAIDGDGTIKQCTELLWFMR